MHLYQAGMPLALLTEWLGHADPETTLVYANSQELHQTGEKPQVA
jgi:integrase/recombinase XerD